MKKEIAEPTVKPDLEELGLRLGALLAGSFQGIREAAMEVLTEAGRSGAVLEGSPIEEALDALTEKILSQDKASEAFKQGYDQGRRDGPKLKPEHLSEIHSDCFDLGYEMGRLARESAEGNQTETLAAEWALGMVLKDKFLLRRS